MSRSDDETASRSRGARTAVRAAGHTASGGHPPYRNRISREPNVLPPKPHGAHRMEFQEYPKWLHFDGEPSVLVADEGEEAAALDARRPKPATKAKAPAPADPAE